jgi:hypothetical protein
MGNKVYLTLAEVVHLRLKCVQNIDTTNGISFEKVVIAGIRLFARTSK